MKLTETTKDSTRPRPRGRVPGRLAHLNGVRAAQYATRSAEAWELLLGGWTVRRIAEHLNVSTGTCQGYIREEMEALGQQRRGNAEIWRQVSLGRLERVIEAWLPRAQDVNDPEAARGAAIVIRTVEAQARLLGLTTEPPAEEPEGAKKTPAMTREMLMKSPALLADLEREVAEIKRAQAGVRLKPVSEAGEGEPRTE